MQDAKVEKKKRDKEKRKKGKERRNLLSEEIDTPEVCRHTPPSKKAWTPMIPIT